MPNSKKNVVIFTDWFLPAYKAGGPIQSVANLINHLKDVFNFYVITSNTDLNEVLDIDQSDLNKWQLKSGYQVVYLDKQHQNRKTYLQIMQNIPVHAVYFNSLFSLKFTLIPLWMTKNTNIKKVLAPRGMLGKGALAIKPTKKKYFLKAFKLLKLPYKLEWHATDISEASEILQYFGNKTRIQIAPNLSAKMSSKPPKKLKEANVLNLFFLSRISIKKNLHLITEMLHKIPVDFTINFKIIGPIEEKKYWEQCLSALNKLPKHIHYEFLGAIPNQELNKVLNELHVLILPTQHENFGHVIMESWQNGCPVIISKNTPWKDLEHQNLGFDINLDQPDEFIKAITLFAKMDNQAFETWSLASFNFAKTFTEDPKLITQTKALFE